jgi:hypothetical protein
MHRWFGMQQCRQHSVFVIHTISLLLVLDVLLKKLVLFSDCGAAALTT